MACADEYATVAGLQWEHVPRATEVRRLGVIGYDGTRGNTTLNGRDARGGGDMIDAHGKCREVVVAIVCAHLWQVEALADLAAHRHADEALSGTCHEVDVLGRGKLGCADEVALVLSIRIVEHEDALASAEGCESVFY